MSKRKPDALLVLYDEAKGLRRPTVKLFNPSPRIERDVNDWIRGEEEITVHRVDWLPSGGLLGASVTYSRNDPTQTLRITVPGLELEQKRALKRGPIERLSVFVIFLGVLMAFGGMIMFTVFYPETWYGGSGALIDSRLAVKSTILVLGLGIVCVMAALAAIMRGRIR